MLKIGISACFFHESEARDLQGMTLQYIEQNVAHWLMQRDVLAFMVPSPEGGTRRPGSTATLSLRRRARRPRPDGRLDVCPEATVKRRSNRNGTAIAFATTTRSSCCARSWHASPCSASAEAPRIINVGIGGTLYQDISNAIPGRAQSSQLGDLRAELPRDVDRGGHGLARLYPGPRSSRPTPFTIRQ